jgi:Fur family ferric uptake transcriptional regulator
LGTVYRNLERMAVLGTIRKLEFSGAEARFDGDVERHDHVRCVRCGRVDDTPSPPLDLSHTAQHDLGGYRILGYRLEFVGLCPDCRKSEKREPGNADSRAGS